MPWGQNHDRKKLHWSPLDITSIHPIIVKIFKRKVGAFIFTFFNELHLKRIEKKINGDNLLFIKITAKTSRRHGRIRGGKNHHFATPNEIMGQGNDHSWAAKILS